MSTTPAQSKTAAEIAVIVPVHNAGDYLQPCLASIAGQSLSNFACYLVDDGSTDGSAAVCDAMAAQDLRFIPLHRAQCGASAARAAGLRAALVDGAAWISFCDADDLLHPQFLQTLRNAAEATQLPVACCRYDSFTDAPPKEAAPAAPRPLQSPAHLEALLHHHTVDFSLCNKLYRADALTPEMLDNGYAYNEDLLANWQIFSGVAGCAFCDFDGYHYRQHSDSASHRPLAPQSIDEQRRAALYIREHAEPDMQQSANAFYYEKLVYLASMILRRDDAAAYRTQLNELAVGIAAGRKDPHLGRNPRLPFSIRVAAFGTAKCPKLWCRLCRVLLKDRR